MKLRYVTLLASLALTTALSSAEVVAKNSRLYGKGNLFTMEQLPPGLFKQTLKSLPEASQKNAMDWLNRHSFSTADFEHLRLDPQGGIFYEDPAADGSSVESRSTAPVVSALNLTETFSLHSKPGASRKLFLDFDGRLVTGTIWNQNAGVSSLDMKPYDSDGDINSFSQAELDAIAEAWRRIAEDFAPFDIDVTTESPSSFGPNVGVLLVTNKTDKNGNTIFNCSCGGVAYVGVWGLSNFEYYQPALVFVEGVGPGPHNISEAGSHEVGHNLGLSHDGTGSTGYYTGHGSGNVSWAPIMGVGYYQEVTQWSKGEYSGANQPQDDVAIMSGLLTTRSDDHENSDFSQATPLVVNSGSVVSTSPVTDPDNSNPSNKGLIEIRGDVDLFSFESGSGDIDLSINPGWFETFSSGDHRGMNIDIEARLYDSFGTQLAVSNPANDTFARITSTVGAGTYYLAIDGVGYGDVLGTGYSDYGSLGNYYISGAVPELNPGTPTASFTANCNELACSFDGSASSDSDGSLVSYSWSLGDGTVASGANVSHTYAQAGDYSVALTVTDNDGFSDVDTQTVSVTVPVPPVASFTANCTDLTCSFGGSSTSDDGVIQSYDWDYGDGTTGSGVNSTHSYATAGSYTVTLTVTDSDGLTDTAQNNVAPTEPPPAPPAAPTNLTGDVVKEGKGKNATLVSVQLNWTDNSNNETQFEIERCIQSGKGRNKTCDFGLLGSVSANVTSFSDESPVSDARYRVRAVNDAGSSGYSNTVNP